MQTLLMLAALVLAQGASDVAAPVTLTGRITVDDGSPLPTVDTFRGPNITFGLAATLPEWGGQLAEATTKADGSFVLTLVTAAGSGQFRLNTTRIPLGLYVKSISYGAVDLLKLPLTIVRNRTPDEIRIVLTRIPPEGTGGVKLSGRVTKLENAAPGTPLMISLQTTSGGGNVLRLGLIPVKADGTFEISGVPAGRYRIRSQPGTNQIGELTVADQNISGIEIGLIRPGTQSLLITSDPMAPFSGASLLPPRGSLSSVAQPATPPIPAAGLGLISVSQTVNQLGRKYYEGAISLYRVEQAGQILDEKHLDGAPLLFTLAPGNYELSSYFRGCDGNCGQLDAPEVFCSTPFTVRNGDVLYAERVVQGLACTIRVFAPAR